MPVFHRPLEVVSSTVFKVVFTSGGDLGSVVVAIVHVSDGGDGRRGENAHPVTACDQRTLKRGPESHGFNEFAARQLQTPSIA